MNTRRLRPKWTIGTMLLVVGWSSVVVWLNVRPDIGYDDPLFELTEHYHVVYGHPWIYAHRKTPATIPQESIRLRPGDVFSYWRLAGNVVVGMLAVTVMTCISSYLFALIKSGLLRDRRRLIPRKWAISTILLIVGWSSLVGWLNVRPRIHRNDPIVIDSIESQTTVVYYGYPWAYTCVIFWDKRQDILRSPPTIDYWRLAYNLLMGLLAVAVLTWTSKYLLRAIIAILRAFMSKPPPADVDGD